MEAYEFPNAERGLIALLRAELAYVASVDIPNPRPAVFVQVTRVGGPSRLVTDHPMVTFYCWGPSWSGAWDVVKRVRQRVMSVAQIEGLPVYERREVGGPVRSPDPVSGAPRYQFTAQLSVRGSHPSP